MPKPVTHVATTDIKDMMNPGPDRRMDLPGFDTEFVDFPHYIIRITEKIWHDREVEKIHDWYADDCPIHTLAGDIAGAQTVVENTYATLKAFPDRRLDADNVIWSDDGAGGFYSSHLITSKMTNRGDSEFGPATGKQVRILTIADCLCSNNQVIEEWLVRDNLSLVEQLGLDVNTLARKQAQADLESGDSLIEFHADNRARTASASNQTLEGASDVAVKAFRRLWTGIGPKLDELYDFRVDATYPGGASPYGPDQIEGWMTPLLASFSDSQLSIDHVAEIPYLGAARDVALRWSFSGRHVSAGRYGAATGAPIYIMGVSHFRVMNGRVREEITIWDDLAVRRQIETARL